jgi:phosphate transport system protein
MVAEGRSFRPNPRAGIGKIARATWQQLTGGHAQHLWTSRQTYHAEVDGLVSDLATIVRLAGQLMVNASDALHEADLKFAEVVISDADEMKTRCKDADQRCLDLLGLTASGTTDLRMVVAAMRVVKDLQRMCNLAQQIAEIARLKHPVEPIPADIRPVSLQMGMLASRLAEEAAAAIESRDPIFAARLEQSDDEVDALRRRIFEILFSDDWSHGVEPAVDTALIGLYYERFADHAVAIARKVTVCRSQRHSADVTPRVTRTGVHRSHPGDENDHRGH